MSNIAYFLQKLDSHHRFCFVLLARCLSGNNPRVYPHFRRPPLSVTNSCHKYTSNLDQNRRVKKLNFPDPALKDHYVLKQSIKDKQGRKIGFFTVSTVIQIQSHELS